LNFITYPDRDSLVMGVADCIASDLAGMLVHKERVSFTGAGGGTPGPVYDALSAVSHVDWARVDVVPGDERWVPETSPRSNAAQLRARLLQGPAKAARLHPLYCDHATPEDGIDQLITQVTPLLPLSVSLLGMGDDMHTASLFPGAQGLEGALARNAPPLAVIHAQAAGEPRVTFTAATLRASMHLHVLITGAQKRKALDRAVTLPETDAPIRAVIENATIHWAE